MGAQVFSDNVYKLHRMPNTITSDRGTIFINKFWQELFKLERVGINLFVVYRPQTDGQTEVVSKCLENYLCMVGEMP